MSKETINENKSFAVVKVAGTQLKVQEGGKYEVRKVEGNKGDKLSISDVLLVSNGDSVLVGKPTVEGASVEFVIDSQKQGEKLAVFKYKAKARYRRSYGSRSLITRLEVKKIKLSK